MTQALVQQTRSRGVPPGYQEAWNMVTGQLRMEMTSGSFNSYVLPLKPLGFKEGVFRVGAVNQESIIWVNSRLLKTVTKLLESVYSQPVTLRLSLIKARPAGRADASQAEEVEAPSVPTRAAVEVVAPAVPEAVAPEKPAGRKKKTGAQESSPSEGGSPRKIQLQRAYGTERARVVQPERGMFLTMYFFNHWLPLLGHSALTTILAARSLCYWNPMTGELRNVIETDMTELATRADVSVRTVKDVLNHPLVKQYFLRYKVRRVMTPNGVRTAGIVLQVRMDDPLTPEDQGQYQLAEEERWYTADFEDEE